MSDLSFYKGVLWKALALLLIFNLGFAALYPMEVLGRVSAYNTLFAGRKRLPYGDDPSKSYNLTISNIPAMFASHEISAPKPPGEFRVILIGDSSTWGWLLPVQDTLSEQMNRLAPEGSHIRVYNLGYPVMSLTKDLLLLQYAMRYQPDAVIWLVTLESFPYDKQLYSPLLQQNGREVQSLIQQHGLSLNAVDPGLHSPTVWERTIIGARRPLADLARLQLYGAAWAATGIDQYIPPSYTPRASDLENDTSFHNLTPPQLKPSDVMLDVLHAGSRMVVDVPLLIINEPMFISQGRNSDVRYNFYYPRWAYDGYRVLLQNEATKNGWRYLDLWDMIAPGEFTNSAVHLSAAGSRELATRLMRELLGIRANH